MGKIGLLTIHDTLNYGSLLQTYALYKAIESLGKDIELIDYKCKAIVDRETTYSLKDCRSVKDVVKSLMWHGAMQRKHDNFWNFMQKNMKLTETYTKESIKKANDIFDTFVVGSDIVWGTGITGKDWTYFLDFAEDNKKKIAFSSSVGTKWENEDREKVIKYLQRFDAISVREELAQQWIKDMGIDVQVTCDPTMLWESDFWKNMITTLRSNEEPYVLVYMWTKDMRTLNHAKEYAKNHGLRVKCQQFYNPIKGVENVKPVTLEEWISLIANAQTVFTASYHGLLYSLYFHKDVYYYNRENKSRMESLGQELNISHREISKEFSERATIDYDYVDQKLEEKRNYSLQLLKERIKDL